MSAKGVRALSEFVLTGATAAERGGLPPTFFPSELLNMAASGMLPRGRDLCRGRLRRSLFPSSISTLCAKGLGALSKLVLTGATSAEWGRFLVGFRTADLLETAG